jgi:hypothetical protein
MKNIFKVENMTKFKNFILNLKKKYYGKTNPVEEIVEDREKIEPNMLKTKPLDDFKSNKIKGMTFPVDRLCVMRSHFPYEVPFRIKVDGENYSNDESVKYYRYDCFLLDKNGVEEFLGSGKRIYNYKAVKLTGDHIGYICNCEINYPGPHENYRPYERCEVGVAQTLYASGDEFLLTGEPGYDKCQNWYQGDKLELTWEEINDCIYNLNREGYINAYNEIYNTKFKDNLEKNAIDRLFEQIEKIYTDNVGIAYIKAKYLCEFECPNFKEKRLGKDEITYNRSDFFMCEVPASQIKKDVQYRFIGVSGENAGKIYMSDDGGKMLKDEKGRSFVRIEKPNSLKLIDVKPETIYYTNTIQNEADYINATRINEAVKIKEQQDAIDSLFEY